MSRSRLVLGLVLAVVTGVLVCAITHAWSCYRRDDYSRQALVRLAYAICHRPWNGNEKDLSSAAMESLLVGLGDNGSPHVTALVRNDEGVPIDGWGNPFLLRPSPMPGVKDVYVLEVRSSGPDAVFDTDDDKSYNAGSLDVITYILQDYRSPHVRWEFVLSGGDVHAKRVALRPPERMVFYSLRAPASDLRREIERWKAAEPSSNKNGTAGTSAVVRLAVPADPSKPIETAPLDAQNDELLAFLDRLRETCLREGREGSDIPSAFNRYRRVKQWIMGIT